MQEGVYQKPARNVDELKQHIPLQHGRESNRASLISGEIVLMHVLKPEANTLNNYFDVFIQTCEFVWTFNACITVVMNRLTHAVFHKVV